jgi:hypothetical protein
MGVIIVETDESKKQEIIDGVRKGSIMWWSHFNFNREFDFSDEKMINDNQIIVVETNVDRKQSLRTH